MVRASPATLSRAGIVTVAACGIALGSYLPWVSGSIDGIAFRQSGFERGHGWPFTLAAVALVCVALLAARIRPLRWAAVALAVAIAWFTLRELVDVRDTITTMNASPTINANIGIGLWLITGCTIIALLASFRLREPT
jgi:hypothetical protein